MKSPIRLALVVFISIASCKKETVVKVEDVPPPIINMQLVEIGKLSESRYGVAVAAVGNKLLFAGGTDGYTNFSTVDIYDINTQTWSAAQLSEARAGIAAVAIGSKILFAGGVKQFDWDNGWYNTTSRVDIFDISTNTWTITELPEPRHFIYEQKGAAVGNKAFFAGRYDNYVADNIFIYDIPSDSWTTRPLGLQRYEHAITSAGNKVFIAGGDTFGGPTKNIDVYDAISNVWTIDSLSEGRKLLKAATTGDRAFFAGGFSVYQPYSNGVDIYNSNTQSWSATHLSRFTVLSGIAFAGQRALFFGSNRVDIYDIAANKWYIADIPQSFGDFASFVNAGENAYAVDGSQVWRVQF